MDQSIKKIPLYTGSVLSKKKSKKESIACAQILTEPQECFNNYEYNLNTIVHKENQVSKEVDSLNISKKNLEKL